MIAMGAVPRDVATSRVVNAPRAGPVISLTDSGVSTGYSRARRGGVKQKAARQGFATVTGDEPTGRLRKDLAAEKVVLDPALTVCRIRQRSRHNSGTPSLGHTR
jgi:hypothetical protein